MNKPNTPPILIPANEAGDILMQGGVIAYPTESSYGLGCDAFNREAVLKIARLKKRDPNKTFLMLIANYQQAQHLIAKDSLHLLEKAKEYWPGPYTLLFPAADTCPEWLQHKGKIALRITSNSIASTLCKTISHPIISTSANIQGQAALMQAEGIKKVFPNISAIIAGQPEGKKPSTIIDLNDNKTIRH